MFVDINKKKFWWSMNKDGSNLTITVIDEAILEGLQREALQRAEWAYSDCLVAFETLGVMPTKAQKQEILVDLAMKKLKGLLYKNNIRF